MLKSVYWWWHVFLVLNLNIEGDFKVKFVTVNGCLYVWFQLMEGRISEMALILVRLKVKLKSLKYISQKSPYQRKNTLFFVLKLKVCWLSLLNFASHQIAKCRKSHEIWKNYHTLYNRRLILKMKGFVERKITPFKYFKIQNI